MRDPGPTVVHPRTECLHGPIGLHARRPRLSWEVGSSRRGTVQAACRIVAGSAPDGPGCRLAVTISANVDARIVLPGAGEVTEGGVTVAAAEGIRSVDGTDGATIVTAGSGTYVFDVAGISEPAAP